MQTGGKELGNHDSNFEQPVFCNGKDFISL